MSKHKKRKIGLPPGTLVYTGNKSTEHIETLIIQYNENKLIERFYNEQDKQETTTDTVTWYDVRGLSNIHNIEQIGASFAINRLALEDILDINQRPKLEEFENGIFIILEGITWDDKRDEIITEQISIFLGKHFVITFQEDEDDTFAPIKDRLKNKVGKIREKGSDYLLYSMVDLLVDNYFHVVDKFDTICLDLETLILENVEQVERNKIYKLKRKTQEMRKLLYPTKEAISKLINSESIYIEKITKIYCEDVKDHIAQISDSLDGNREMLINLQDLYHLQLGNKTNHVMKLLTIISTIFIPLTFIVGVYGTNFKHNFPELEWEHGYMFMWVLIIIVAIVSLIYFRVRRWL
jgi:magnesium transporter